MSEDENSAGSPGESEIADSDGSAPKAPPPGSVRQAQERASLRERIAREAQDDVTVAFDECAEVRRSIDAAVKAVEAALGKCAGLERKCSGTWGRRLFLSRRLFTKPTMAVLAAARKHLLASARQLDMASRQREALLEEAADPGLDH